MQKKEICYRSILIKRVHTKKEKEECIQVVERQENCDERKKTCQYENESDFKKDSDSVWYMRNSGVWNTCISIILLQGTRLNIYQMQFNGRARLSCAGNRPNYWR